MVEMDDAGLLARARTGDEAAFSLLFGRYQRQVFRYALYMGGPGVADDLVQDTFLTVLRQKSRQDAPAGSVIGYLIGIARHLLMKRGGTKDWANEPVLDDVAASDEPSALDRLVEVESIETIRAAVRSLPPAYREVIVLCELQDVDYQSAAAMVQCPIGTIRSRLSRARALLASKLARERESMGVRR